MKTLIMFLLLLLTCSSMCFVEELSYIQKEDIMVSIGNVVSYLVLIIGGAFVMLFVKRLFYTMHKESMKSLEIELKKISIQEKPLEILNMQYVQREISHEEYLKMKNEIEGNNHNNPNKTNIMTIKRRMRAIPEKCP